MNMSPTVNLYTYDQKIFKTEIKEAKLSDFIKTMIDDLEWGDGEPEELLPLVDVRSDVLEQILKWMKEHKDDPAWTEGESDAENVRLNAWDANFLEGLGIEMLMEMILASNSLEVKKLLQISCQHLANKIKGKSPDEIRKALGIVNDFTPEEMEMVRKECEWCSEK